MTRETFKAWARPVCTYLGGVGVFVGLFVPVVPAEKLWVAAALAGVFGVSRGVEKIVGKDKPC